MDKRLLIAGGVLVGAIVLIVVSLPQILQWIGFHPAYERTEYDLDGRQALIIATNHDTRKACVGYG